MTDKKALRKHFKELRLSMSAEERKQADVAVQQAFLDSTYDLKKGRFGIFEPDESCEKYCVFDNALCIVPALSYDKDGYRLGFGMGFYDRFLADYNGIKLGLCYDNCMSESFCHDGYDISVDKVFTDKDIYTINTKERK